MPTLDTISSAIRTVFCCTTFRQQEPALPIESGEGTIHEEEQEPQPQSTSPTPPTPYIPPTELNDDDEITPVPTNHLTTPGELFTSSTTSRTPENRSQSPAHPFEPSSSLPASQSLPQQAMISNKTLYRLSHCHEEIYSLKHFLSQSPSLATYRETVLPGIFEVLRRDEVIYLFTRADEGDYVVLAERVRFCEEVLDVAYWDVDSGGNRRLGGWIERELGGVLEANPTNTRALTLLGRSWLLKSQQYLSKISEDGSNSSSSGGSFPFTNTDWTAADEDRDTAEQDRKRQEGVYVDARTTLFPAVEFLGRAVEVMEDQGEVEGETYVLQAEANMSLGNVTVSSEAQAYFRIAVEALKKASLIDGFALPVHLERYLRSFEFVLYD